MDNVELLLHVMGQPFGTQPQIFAIDGRCGAGKTTLASKVQEITGCNVIHMDDYYLPFAQRTDEQMALPGGNMDFERLLSEVLLPLKHGDVAFSRALDCHSNLFRERKILDSSHWTLVEGSYSCHPCLRAFYKLRIFLDISPEQQLIRLKKRNPNTYDLFQKVWIPREETYFQSCNVREDSDLLLFAE